MELYEKINKELGTDYQNDNEIEWYAISRYKKLSEDFIRQFQDYIDWCALPIRQKLSENFIREFQENMDWYYICTYQNLSEGFMREFKDKIDWRTISKYQKLSENFIEEFQDKVVWSIISKYQKLSENFIQKHRQKLNLLVLQNSWHYKTTEEKKQAIIKTGLYECYDDYFIAYKAIRHDRCSLFNFQYKYEKGGIYESWCDCSSNIASFGLSVGTKEYCKEYRGEAQGFIVKVKVKYEDVGRVVHNKDKIRCFKIEILE